jgi:hypothetical protein
MSFITDFGGNVSMEVKEQYWQTYFVLSFVSGFAAASGKTGG